MDVVSFNFDTVLLIGIFIAGFLLRHYYSQYLSKKGENLATKEDIAEITHKIESVKNTYVSQIERLRTSLSIAANQRITFVEQEQRALFQFFDHCVELLADKLRANIGDFPMDQGQSLVKHQQDITDLFTAIILDYYRILLYFDSSSELSSSATKVVQSSLNVRKAYNQHFGKAKLALMKEIESYLSNDKVAYHYSVDRTNEAVRIYHTAMNPHLQEMEKEFYKYMSALNKYLGKQGAGLTVDPLEDFNNNVN